MNREHSFLKLWGIITNKRGSDNNETFISLDHPKVFIELAYNDVYDYQIHIASDSGFSTIDISTLINKDDDEHLWCWKQLYKLNIRKRDIR